jgi:hypothetical protein
MNGFDIITVIAIILFARLGMRLIFRYFKMKNQNPDEDDQDEQDIV